MYGSRPSGGYGSGGNVWAMISPSLMVEQTASSDSRFTRPKVMRLTMTGQRREFSAPPRPLHPPAHIPQSLSPPLAVARPLHLLLALSPFNSLAIPPSPDNFHIP